MKSLMYKNRMVATMIIVSLKNNAFYKHNVWYDVTKTCNANFTILFFIRYHSFPGVSISKSIGHFYFYIVIYIYKIIFNIPFLLNVLVCVLYFHFKITCHVCVFSNDRMSIGYRLFKYKLILNSRRLRYW